MLNLTPSFQMIDLALSVLFSSLIFVVFKLYAVYNIDTVKAIIVNYITACLVGLFYYEGDITVRSLPDQPWLPGTILLGTLFIIVFNLMARTSQKLGVSVASVATKMSLVIPVIAGVWIYNESLGAVKILGILLALAAVYFASMKESKLEVSIKALWLPALVFLGSGIIDSSIKFMEEFYVSSEDFSIFSSSVFAAAATAGLIFILIKSSKSGFQLNTRDIVGGIALGVPNFFSIYFLLRAFQYQGLNSASIFTINNVAIVMLSTLLGIVLFKEHINTKNWMGIGIAILSIIMVALF